MLDKHTGQDWALLLCQSKHQLSTWKNLQGIELVNYIELKKKGLTLLKTPKEKKILKESLSMIVVLLQEVKRCL